MPDTSVEARIRASLRAGADGEPFTPVSPPVVARARRRFIRNALVASRPEPGSDTTLLNSAVVNSLASSSVPPSAITEPHAARMFQRAEPDEPGLGVTISTPGWMRSSHESMFLGLPGRTAMTTTDEVTVPPLAPSAQVSSTRPASTRRVTSLESEKCT